MSKGAKSFQLDGIKEAFEILDNLPDSLRSKFLQSVNRTTVNKVMKKPLAGEHKEATKVRTERGHPNAVLFGITTDFFWYRFLEYGTTTRRRRSGGGSTGSMSAKPFFQRYVDSKIKAVLKETNQGYSTLMEKWLKRRIKSTGKQLGKL